MVKEINKNQKADLSSLANVASLLYNNNTNHLQQQQQNQLLLQNNTADMNFQDQQSLLATVLMFPSLFMPQTANNNSVASNATTSNQLLNNSLNFQLPLNTTTNNNNNNTNNPSFDQLLQQQLMASNLNNYNNNTFLASLAGNLIQPQQQQQNQHQNEMTASNNIWSKLLTDMSSSLVDTDINQSNILHQMQQLQHTNTLILANNGEVSLKPPPSSNKPKSNQDSSHNKQNAQSNQMKKNGDKLNYKPNKLNQNETMIQTNKQISNGSASYSSASSTSSSTSSNSKSTKPTNSNSSSFSIKDLINNNNNNNNSDHHVSNQAKKSTSNVTSSQNKKSKPINNNNNNKPNDDLNEQNQALLMYAALLQNSSNNSQTIPFNMFSNNTAQNYSLDWLFQLTQGQSNETKLNNNKNEISSNNNKNNNHAYNNNNNKSNESKIKNSSSNNQASNKTQSNSINNNQNNENNKLIANKSRNNFISNMEDQNNELVEEKIRLPLKFGWRRETIIKEVHKNGIKGDVIYYSPCSKKLRTFQEIEKYLSRNSKELESKGIKLTRDNFTFSSKFIIGKYLQLKQMTTAAAASGDESVSTNDELVSDEKLENELKFNILNEEDVILIISKLNPKFCSTLNQSNQNQTDTSNHDSLNSQDSQQYYHQNQNHNHTNGKQQSTNNDSELQFKLDTLKQFKSEQENKHAQMLEMQRLEHEQLEQQKIKLKNQQEQAMIQNRLIQQEKQNRLIEAKNREKFLQRERKTREKWFEHIMTREQQTSRQQPIDIGEEKPAQIIFDSIDDMQEKYLKKMPEFKQLYIDSKETTTKSTITQSDASVAAAEAAVSSASSVASDTNEQENEEQSPEQLKLNWFGDCLQVIEFVNTFGSKLVEPLNKANKSTQSDTQLNENNDFQFSSILSNLELFRSGLENKNEKLKREIVHLLQLLLKCAIKTISDRNMNINDSINRNNESKEEDDDDDDNDGNDSSPKDDDLKLVNEDDFYYVKRIKQLEMNDSTYSELLRLYIKRSLFYLKQRRELTAKKFNIDVTLNLFESLKNYNQSLNEKTFDQLETPIKASIMAWLCDELLTSSSSIAGGAGGDSNEMANQDEYRVASCVVSDLDQAIEELTELKHEKWQLESKSRQIKTEKLTAAINLNKMLVKKTETTTDSSLTETTDTHPTQEQETINESFNSKEKDKQQKSIQQIEKKLTQNEKKRLQVKQSYDKCLNKLRSGIHLGQDRYLRHYWSLSHVGGILIESASQASIGSIYLSDDSVQLMPLLEDDVVKKEEEENNQIKTGEDLEEESAIQKYSHLIERFSTDDPFKFTLKFNDEEIANLTYRQIEYLVRNEIQQKKPEKIDPKYLNHQNNSIILKNTSSKWWLCENEIMFKQLIDCLAKRGYREKLLVKCLTKLNEENFINSNSFAAFTDSNTNNESLTSTTESINPTVFNRITNNLGNIQMFERLNNFFKDFIANTQQPSSQQALKKFLNQLKQQEYREKTKVLKQMYALEDRVFKANLQQPTEKGLEQQQQNNQDSQDSESPLEIAKSRLLELEARIERRYLKYPFVARRKLTNIKMTNNEANKEETTATNDETSMDMEVKEEENQELPTLSSLSSGLPPQANNKTNKIRTIHVDVPQELERWRRLVKNCNTSSQLAILIIELNKLLEWEKSIMKVICQICNCDDNEDKLLLCDNCDKGNHTYCFKPVLDQIPDGDWYCFVCIGKLNGENICCVCGSNEPTCPYYSGSNSSNSSSDLNKCDKCSKSFHGHCMPYARYYVTKHKWHCLNCQNIKPPVSVTNSVDTLNNKRNLSAIHNINNKVNTNNKKKKSPESALNNETVSNSDDCSSSANNTDDVIVSFRKKNNKKFGFTKGKNITNNNKTDKEVTNNKTEKKSNNNKRKRASSHENSNDEIENNENECNQNDLNNKQVEEENGDEENETETEPNQTDNSQNNKSGKTKRNTKKSQLVANKKSRRSDIDKAKAAARPSDSYLSLSSGPKGNPNRDKDLAMCSNLLESMIKNESSLPFANKVDEKIYPDYYELIKEPMDIQTIKLKIKNKEYENKEQFAYDCRLIFDNCEFFNEDDSAIGKAGHKLRAFFETKWLKLFD